MRLSRLVSVTSRERRGVNCRRTQRVYPMALSPPQSSRSVLRRLTSTMGNGRGSESAKRPQLRTRATYLSFRTTHLSRYYPTYHSLTAYDRLSRTLQLRREAASILNAISACSCCLTPSTICFPPLPESADHNWMTAIFITE